VSTSADQIARFGVAFPEARVSSSEHGGRSKDSELAALLDAQLIECFRQGRSEAMGVLFYRYRGLVLGVSCRILRDQAEAEDVTQEVFMDVCRRVELFDAARGSVKMWVLQYAYSRSLQRRKSRSLRLTREINVDEMRDTGVPELHLSPFGVDGLTAEQRARLILDALESLSAEQREVISLAYYQGFSMREIADRSAESIGNIRNQYYRGLKKLRQILSDARCQATAD
jgi:RNA polymerase sigma-70 factor, ECF subfamily